LRESEEMRISAADDTIRGNGPGYVARGRFVLDVVDFVKVLKQMPLYEVVGQ
jgi:hypothetical protein